MEHPTLGVQASVDFYKLPLRVKSSQLVELGFVHSYRGSSEDCTLYLHPNLPGVGYVVQELPLIAITMPEFVLPNQNTYKLVMFSEMGLYTEVDEHSVYQPKEVPLVEQ